MLYKGSSSGLYDEKQLFFMSENLTRQKVSIFKFHKRADFFSQQVRSYKKIFIAEKNPGSLNQGIISYENDKVKPKSLKWNQKNGYFRNKLKFRLISLF